MKKIKSSIASLAFALTFACVLSCNEQDDISNTKINLTSDTPGGLINSKGRSASGRTDASAFDGSEGDPLDLTTAKAWAGNYRSKNQDDIRGHYFGSEIIQQILSQTGSVGIRIYYALDEAGNKKLLIVGVDSEGNDLLPAEGESLEGGGYTIADFSYPCPSYCPPGTGI